MHKRDYGVQRQPQLARARACPKPARLAPEVSAFSADFTVSVWAKYLGPPNTFKEILSQNTDAGSNFYIGQSSSGEIRVSDGWPSTGISFPTDGNWHHYVVVKDDFDTRLYVDDMNVANLGSGIQNPISISPEFRVGRQFAV